MANETVRPLRLADDANLGALRGVAAGTRGKCLPAQSLLEYVDAGILLAK